MWNPNKLIELADRQVPLVNGTPIKTKSSVLRAWSNGETLLCHEHDSTGSVLMQYTLEGKILKQWDPRGWPKISFRNSAYKVSFESYSGNLDYVSLDNPTTHVWTRRNTFPKFALVSMHGGPESIEVDEKRYGGWYEDVIKAGGIVVVWNYPGSKGFGYKHRCLPHKKWIRCIQTEYNKMISEIKKRYHLESRQIILFGASFGGTLAYYTKPSETILGKIIMNPAMDMVIQSERARQSREYSWFKNRFKLRENELSVKSLCDFDKSPAKFLLSSNDEVVDSKFTHKYVKTSIKGGAKYSIINLKGMRHAPRTIKASKSLRMALNEALTSLLVLQTQFLKVKSRLT